ncbi:hypothetical protein AAV96_08940 [Acinetobacter sp. AG1]|uniref:hypothetical protein n=1 Tax=Acinetobacter sp. AG1 TaxID=348388 RepID=UPI000629BCE3|nr:hypothetical protein [Acinetobacter sp. AG1]KKW79018.1 hypothetical protein AAV96_08940 [Acinetobacter sp. AG1]
MSTQYTTPFREFITRDDHGRYHVRLGPQTFSTNYKLTDIRLETENGGTPVDPEYLKNKPYILRNLQQEVKEQRKKERKAMYAKDCFQRTPYSKNQRIAYHNAKSN